MDAEPKTWLQTYRSPFVVDPESWTLTSGGPPPLIGPFGAAPESSDESSSEEPLSDDESLMEEDIEGEEMTEVAPTPIFKPTMVYWHSKSKAVNTNEVSTPTPEDPKVRTNFTLQSGFS
jgi:hypothetical protein